MKFNSDYQAYDLSNTCTCITKISASLPACTFVYVDALIIRSVKSWVGSIGNFDSSYNIKYVHVLYIYIQYMYNYIPTVTN